MTLNKTTLNLKVGATETLTASVAPTDATNKAGKWSTDKAELATVDVNGKVKAIAVGVVKITFTTDDGSFVATCTLTITAVE